RSSRGRKATGAPNLAADRYWTDRDRSGAVSDRPWRIPWAHSAASRPPKGKPFSGGRLLGPLEKQPGTTADRAPSSSTRKARASSSGTGGGTGEGVMARSCVRRKGGGRLKTASRQSGTQDCEPGG